MKRIKYVVVDEYQDVNPIQERLIWTLHELGAGICVVGDDDQTIYQWRGSSVENIQHFESRYPGVEQIRLQENFRSSEGVIERARLFIRVVENRLPKEMQFADAQPFENGDIAVLGFVSPEAEAGHIVETIKSLHGVAFDDGDGERGLSWADMAVLLSSVKNNGTAIKEALEKADIPVVVNGLANLFLSHEAQAARKLIHFVAAVPIKKNKQEIGPPSEEELLRAWENARLGVRKADLRKAIAHAKRVRDGRAGPVNTSLAAVQKLFLNFLALAEVREEKVEGACGRGQVAMFNLGKFSQIVNDWESVNYHLPAHEAFTGFTHFLYRSAEDYYNEGAEDADHLTPDAVQVMTVHQAKGREWPVVFLPALIKNRFPSKNKGKGVWNLIPREAVPNAERYDGSRDDERRLFYVAMTRSKKFLHMTWAPIQGKGNFKNPSPFWEEIRAPRLI